MKKTFQIALLGLSLVSIFVVADENLDLEPCINGEVSATGLFPSQEAEDEYLKSLSQAEALELEPCINGEVSASGLFPSQEAEDQYRMLGKSKKARHQITSAGSNANK